MKFITFFFLVILTIQTHTQLKDKIPDQRPRSPTTPKTVPVVPLDSMLGELGNDMSKCGVDTVAKGCCYCCHKPIVGQVSRRRFLSKKNIRRCQLTYITCCWH